MAKLAIIFLVAFVLFQIAVAAPARIARDAPADDPQQLLKNAADSLNQFFEKTFNKEQLEKMGDSLKQFGETVSEQGKKLVQQAEENLQKFKKE